MIVSHFAYLYNRDKEGRKSRALELLTGQHSGNCPTNDPPVPVELKNTTIYMRYYMGHIISALL